MCRMYVITAKISHSSGTTSAHCVWRYSRAVLLLSRSRTWWPAVALRIAASFTVLNGNEKFAVVYTYLSLLAPFCIMALKHSCLTDEHHEICTLWWSRLVCVMCQPTHKSQTHIAAAAMFDLCDYCMVLAVVCDKHAPMASADVIFIYGEP
jgi:hypothetical protein